jgi:hypothetical protein
MGLTTTRSNDGAMTEEARAHVMDAVRWQRWWAENARQGMRPGMREPEGCPDAFVNRVVPLIRAIGKDRRP